MPRDIETDKYVHNHKNGLFFMVWKKEVDYEEALAAYENWEIDEGQLRKANRELCKQYHKLYLMDQFNIIIIDLSLIHI